jgi:P4 family phage/plasmid primase-like protien
MTAKSSDPERTPEGAAADIGGPNTRAVIQGSPSLEIRNKVCMVAEIRVYGPHPDRVPSAKRRSDPCLLAERNRLLAEFDTFLGAAADVGEAFNRLCERELPYRTSSLLSVPGEFPLRLWKVRANGEETPDVGEFAACLSSTSVYACPTDTFTGSGFELLRYSDGLYIDGAKAYLHAHVERAHRAAGLTARNGVADEIARSVARQAFVERHSFNPSGLLNLSNGVLDLESGTLTPHSAGLRFTYKLPTRFDPEATCPSFLKFLGEVLPRETDRREVQKLFGYCFVSGHPYQVAHLFVGEGNNGKSTLISVLTALLGSENVSAETLQSLNENRFSSAKLFGKLLNAFADLPSNPLKQSSTFKTLTGGDQVRAELKFGAIFYFANSAKLVFSANELPEVNDRTRAFWRRWQLILFERDLTGREDRSLGRRLADELPGILNWALVGRRLLKRDDGFNAELGGEGLKAEWRRRSDTLAWFAADGVESDPEGWVPKEDFYQAYVEFCASNRAPAKSPEQVGKELPKHYPQARTEKRRPVPGEPQLRGWRGIRLRWADPVSLGSPASTTDPGTGEAGEAGGSHLGGEPPDHEAGDDSGVPAGVARCPLGRVLNLQGRATLLHRDDQTPCWHPVDGLDVRRPVEPAPGPTRAILALTPARGPREAP